MPRAQTMSVDIDDFKGLVDAVDIRYGHDTIVTDLVAQLDKMVATLESHGRVYRRRKHQRAGISGFRNVSLHAKSGKWTGRVRYTDGRGTPKRFQTGYYTDPADASAAVEEFRTKMGLP